MSELLKKLLLTFIFTMWIFYFLDIFSPRGICITKHSIYFEKNSTKNKQHNIIFCNNKTHSYFYKNKNSKLHNQFSKIHIPIPTNSQVKSSNFKPTFYENLTYDENTFLNKINEYRFQNNLPNLILDLELYNIATIKSLDLKSSKNFSHISKNFGKLNDLLNKYHIPYSSSKENIISASNLNVALKKLINSKNHNELILTKENIYTGLSIIDSPIYGKIIVQIFIKK